jgi:uncharacterized repeat protein (TIGR02543 family)
LNAAIDSLYASSWQRDPVSYSADVASGLTEANTLINSVSDPTAIKNVVLFTTGMTSEGNYDYDGHYDENTIASNWVRSDNNVKLYAYANEAYKAAEIVKKNATLHTIGLFQTLEDIPEEGREIMLFFKLCALEWATSPNHFYDVKDPGELEYVFGEIADSIVKKTGTFKYPPTKGDRDISATYYYDDAYFYEKSSTYNEHLATMSLCLDLSSWGSYDVGGNYSLKMTNARNLLAELGFKDFDHNYMDFSYKGIAGKPTEDSIGAVAASKAVKAGGKDYTLIAVAIRGGVYEREWASNFTIGASGQHQGFSEARDQVVTFLQEYISENNISGDIKLWLTGYSRAAATANLVAGKIDEGVVSFPGCTLALSDLYAYTFETPAGALESDTNANSQVYNNIFNIINLNDLVPKVAPEAWLFDRYGTDQEIPSAETEASGYGAKLSTMLARYNEIEGASPYSVDDFYMMNVKIDDWEQLPDDMPPMIIGRDEDSLMSQNSFLNEYVTLLANNYLKDRQTYVDEYQDEIRSVCGVFFGDSTSKNDDFIGLFTGKLKDNWAWIAYDYLTGNEIGTCARIVLYWEESLDEMGITEYSQAEFDRAVKVVMGLLAKLLVEQSSMTATLFFNFGPIVQAHTPEVCLAWLQSMDSHYTDGGAPGFTSGQYRIVRINCPVDVDVYNDAGLLVASITDDKPQKVSSIIASLNEDGEKIVFLPASEGYTVKIAATGDGLMTYSVNEYDPEANGVNRLVNYYDLPLVTGREFTGSLPAYSDADLEDRSKDASSVLYTLSADGKEILPSEELSGESATSARFTVNATPSDRTIGLVFGSGSRQLGAFAKVKAVPYPDSRFLGWYDNEGKLVGSESEYRMRVEEDTDLIAKFESTKPLEQDPDTNVPVELDAISLGQSSIALDIGDTASLSVNYSPANATEQSAATWSSSNAKIATVDAKGIVSAKAEGTVTITATVHTESGAKTATCQVTVTDPNPQILLKAINLNKTALSLDIGKTSILSVNYSPANATEKPAATWSSSDAKIATVDAKGMVSAKAEGAVTITATVHTESGAKMAICHVTVTDPNPQILLNAITLNKTSLALDVGKTSSLSVNYSPANATEQPAATWSSSDAKIATVDAEGIVFAKAEGIATITATVHTESGAKTATCHVTVTDPNPEILLKAINLNKTSLTLDVGKTSILSVNYSPANATEQPTATWTSSNAKVASVDTKGIVSAKTKGTATITATIKAKSGTKTDACKVTVTGPDAEPPLNTASPELPLDPAVPESKPNTIDAANVPLSTIDLNQTPLNFIDQNNTSLVSDAGNASTANSTPVSKQAKSLKIVKIKFSAGDGKIKRTKSGKIIKEKSLTKKLTAGKKFGSLPKVSRDGTYKFKGWYTKKFGGKKVTAKTVVFKKNRTLYAQWQARYGKPKAAAVVRVRAGSYTASHIKGYVNRMTKFRVTGKVDRPGLSDDWCKVSYTNGSGEKITGYVYANLIDIYWGNMT